jgi:ribosomal protein S13
MEKFKPENRSRIKYLDENVLNDLKRKIKENFVNEEKLKKEIAANLEAIKNLDSTNLKDKEI